LATATATAWMRWLHSYSSGIVCSQCTVERRTKDEKGREKGEEEDCSHCTFTLCM